MALQGRRVQLILSESILKRVAYSAVATGLSRSEVVEAMLWRAAQAYADDRRAHSASVKAPVKA